MDSLASTNSKSVHHSLELQVAKVYGIGQPNLQIKKLSVQQQKGVLDCGVFAIAFAVEVCQGRSPYTASFDQSRMRKHLHTYLQQGVLSSFPKGLKCKEAIPRPKCQLFTVKINCYCGMPDSYDANMIECEECKMWVHFSCAGMNANDCLATPFCCIINFVSLSNYSVPNLQ